MPQVYRAIRPMFQNNQWRIFPNDVVQLISGPEAGLTGRVLEVVKDRKRPEVIVEGLNLRKKKIQFGLKPDDFFVVTMEAPVHYSQVMLVDPASKQPVRTIFRYTADGTKVRIGVRTEVKVGEDGRVVEKERLANIIPIPVEKDDKAAKYGLCGAKDTPEDEVRRVTFDPMAPFPFQPPDTRPSRLPMPADADASSSQAPADKGIWATPPWFGAPESAMAEALAQLPSSSSSSPMPLMQSPGMGTSPRPGVFGAQRQYCTCSSLTQDRQQGQQSGAARGTLVWEWLVSKQRQTELQWRQDPGSEGSEAGVQPCA